MERQRKAREESSKKINAPDADESRDYGSTTILEGVKAARKSKAGAKLSETQGLTLGIKFALVISLVTALVLLISQMLVYFQIQAALLWEVDRKGAALVKSLTTLAGKYVQECQAIIDSAKGKTKDEIKAQREQIEQQYQESLESIRFYDHQQQKPNEILNITLLSNVGNIATLQAGPFKGNTIEGMTRSFQNPQTRAVYKEIQILDGYLRMEQDVVGVKNYSLNIPSGKITVLVMLSAQDIQKLNEKLFSNIFITAVIAIIIGIAIAILLAQHVTKPVQQLIRDIEIVAQGNLKHTTKPTSRDEIGRLAYTFNVMTQNLYAAHQAELSNQAREHEMVIAKEIQSNLLPSQIPQIPGYEIATYYCPSKEVGGDYYDFIEIDSDHIGLVIADVSGKSIPGSMVMTMTRSLIRMASPQQLSPAKIFSQVNRTLAKDIMRGMFVTSMYGILEIFQHKLLLSSAGHNPVVVARAANQQNELINPKGMALGLDKGNMFDKTIHDQSIALQPGDRVVFYTDGVPEAMNPKNEEFGEERFLQIITKTGKQSCQAFVQSLVQTLTQWRGNGPQSDDITILVIKRKELS